MISYFNSGYLIRYLVVFIISITIWLPAFLLPKVFIEPNSAISLFQFNADWLNNYAKVFIFLSFIITLITALALNQILREYDIVSINNTSGLAAYIMLVSVLPIFTSINSFIIINLFLIIFIQSLLKLSVVEEPVSVIFNASLYLGIASLFFLPLFYLLLLIWIAMLINRQLELRNFIISIAGLVLPYFFVFAWFFWNDTAHTNWNILLIKLSDISFITSFNVFGLYEIIILSLVALIIISGFFFYLGKLNEKGNFVRKNLLISIYFMLTTSIIALVFFNHATNLLVLGIPAAIIVSTTVYSLNKSHIFNIYFVLLFIASLLYHYYQLFDAKEILFK